MPVIVASRLPYGFVDVDTDSDDEGSTDCIDEIADEFVVHFHDFL